MTPHATISAGRASSRFALLLLLPLVVLLAASPRSATGADAAQPIPEHAAATLERFYATLLESMRDAKRLGVEGRYRKLDPAVRTAFDLPAMTRIAVGPAWTSIGAPTQTALVDAFSRMSVASY